MLPQSLMVFCCILLMLAGCLEGGQAVKQAGSHWKQSPLEVQLGKYLQLQFQIVPAHPEMNLGFSVIKSKPFYNMKQKKFAKNGKESMMWGKLHKFISP